jgi:hypothetical protein
MDTRETLDLRWVATNFSSQSDSSRWMETLARLDSDIQVGRRYLDPGWQLSAESASETIRAYRLEKEGDCLGLAVFQLQDRPLNLQFGEVTLARIPLQRLTMVSEPLLDSRIPQMEMQLALLSLVELLMRVESADTCIFLEGLPVNGELGRFVLDGRLDHLYQRVLIGAPFEHQFIRMPKSYGAYLKELGGRSRQSVQYSQRKLRKDMIGEVRIRAFAAPCEVAAFLRDAVSVSEQTYQARLLGLGLADSEAFRSWLTYAAENGWLRSYVMYCRDEPAAFMLGYFHGSTYYYDDVGYDPKFAKWSVGSVLQLMVVEDLLNLDRPPGTFDFSIGFGLHKARFGNWSRTEVNLLLMPRGLGTSVKILSYKATNSISNAVARLLARLGLKDRMKRWIRRRTLSDVT